MLRHFRHLVLQAVGGVGRKAQQLRFLRAQLRQPLDQDARVVRIAVLGALGRGLEQFFARGAVGQFDLCRLLRRVLQRQHPAALELAIFRRCGGSVDLAAGKSGEVRLVLGDERAGLGCGQQLVLEIRRQGGFFLVQLAQRGLVGRGQLRTGAHEVAVVAFGEVFGFGIQAIAMVVQMLHARKEFRIEEDRIRVRGELGRLFFLDLLQRVVGVGLDDRAEHLAGAGQQRAAAFHRDDGVVERRRCLVVRNFLDFRDLLLHALLDRRLIVAVLDLVEWRRLILQRAGGEERVGRGSGGSVFVRGGLLRRLGTGGQDDGHGDQQGA